MSVERNKAIARRLFEVWNTGNLDAIEELYATDYVADYRPYAPLRRGHDAIRGMVLKLPRFRGHRTIWVRGVHDGQDKSSLRA
jgi:ketosteroid isomerase-like protein